MSINTAKAKKEQGTLLDELQALLEEQVEMVKSGNLKAVEALAEQSNSVIAEMVKTPLPPSFESKRQYEHLTTLYKKLELMIEAEKDAVSKQLRKVGNGKKTIRAYYR